MRPTKISQINMSLITINMKKNTVATEIINIEVIKIIKIHLINTKMKANIVLILEMNKITIKKIINNLKITAILVLQL